MKIKLNEKERDLLLIAATNRVQYYIGKTTPRGIIDSIFHVSIAINDGADDFGEVTLTCFSNWLKDLLDEEKFIIYFNDIADLLVKIRLSLRCNK